MAIETKRLNITEASLSDSDFFLKLMNSPNWLAHIGDRGITSEKLAQEHLQNNLIKSYVENDYGLYKISLKQSNTPIGICGFLKRDYLDHPDIGFAILPRFERKGFVSEAAIAVLNFGKETLDFQKVFGITTQENTRSQKLLEKLGFKEIGTINPPEAAKEFLLFSNSWE